MTPKLEKLFAGWKSGDVPAKNVETVPVAAKSAVYLMDKPGALQSVIIAGVVAPPQGEPAGDRNRGDERQPGRHVRLAAEYESARGQALVVRSAHRFFAKPGRSGRSIIFAPVQTDKTKESLVEMNKEFRGIVGDHPIGADELAKIQANETLKLPGSRETLDALGQSIMDLVQFGLPRRLLRYIRRKSPRAQDQ